MMTPSKQSVIQTKDPFKDFSSFEILWFDLATKVRELVMEMTEPLNDKLYNYKDLIDQ